MERTSGVTWAVAHRVGHRVVSTVTLAAVGMLLTACNETGRCLRTNGRGTCLETDKGTTLNGWIGEHLGLIGVIAAVLVAWVAIASSARRKAAEQSEADQQRQAAGRRERERASAAQRATEEERARVEELERQRQQAAQRAAAEAAEVEQRAAAQAAAAERDRLVREEMDRLRREGGGL